MLPPPCECCEPDQCALCLAERGAWNALNWPGTLTATLSGGCCANMNGTVTLTRVGGSPVPRYGGVSVTVHDCTASPGPQPLSLTLLCNGTRWTIGGVSDCLRPHITSNNWRVDATLVDCDPFHATASVTISDSTNASCCNGTLSIEITE